MSKKLQEYKGKNISVSFDGSLCIHARQCVTTLPSVFQANAPGPWIVPDNAEVEELTALIRRCPSGALRFTRLDGGCEEVAAQRNVVAVLENGPLAVRGTFTINGETQGVRAVLCRCGASQNKPFCDGSHKKAGFVATGEPATPDELGELEAHAQLDFKPLKDGPVLASGPMEITAGTGRAIKRGSKAAFCRCGASQNKPYCDGSHKAVGFTAD